jgi:hypothetical protein
LFNAVARTGVPKPKIKIPATEREQRLGAVDGSSGLKQAGQAINHNIAAGIG